MHNVKDELLENVHLDNRIVNVCRVHESFAQFVPMTLAQAIANDGRRLWLDTAGQQRRQAIVRETATGADQ